MQRLVLKQASLGTANVALNGEDFNNFLAHPLLKPPSISGIASDDETKNLQFTQDEVIIDPKSKTVTFFVHCNQEKWRCVLKRTNHADRRATIVVSAVEQGDNTDDLSLELSEKLTSYFNEIVYELDGTFLTFRDMMITDKGTSPSVLLQMGIKVEKFPSRNLAF